MACAWPALLPMPSISVSACCHCDGPLKGSWQATCTLALTVSRLNGYWPISPWSRPSSDRGSRTRTFATVAHHISTLLWQWAPRRHPHKARGWIKEKYFRSEHGNNGVFLGHVRRPQGKWQDVCLCRTSSVPMRRHTKIQGEANPYDPQWEPYFEARSGVRMARNLQGRRQLLRLWKEQEGLCAVCQQRITQLTGWHSHHLVWRTHGGSDRAENHVLNGR